VVHRCADRRRRGARLWAGTGLVVARVPRRVGRRCLRDARSGHDGDDPAVDRAGPSRARADAQTAAPRVAQRAGARPVPQDPARHVADRARRDRSGHGLVGRLAVLRAPALGHAARLWPGHAVRRGTGIPGQRMRATLRSRERLGNDGHLAGPVAASVAIRQGQRLSRDDHSEAVRRQRLWRLRALAGHHEARDALLGGRRLRDGAELARPRRTAAALRHRRAEESLSAASRARRRDPLLRADEPLRRLGRGRDSRCRHRLQEHVRGARDARLSRHVEQALHHARPDRDGARSRVPRARSRPSARPRRRAGHHLRADSDPPPRREHRPPSLAAQCRVPERPELGQRRVHSARLGDRRTRAGRQRLAHADGMPRGGPRDFTAVVECGHVENRGARRGRVCGRAASVPHGDRQVRGRAGSARPHGRQPLRDGRRAPPVRAGRRSRRETVGDFGDLEVPHHRTQPRSDR